MTAYQSAPDEFIETLIVLMIQNDYQPNIHYRDDVYRLVNELLSLNQCLASLILHCIPAKKINAGMLEVLLTDIFKHDADQAKSIAEEFVTTTVPKSGEIRSKAIVAARLIALHADDSSWSVLWSAVQQDHKFGREVLEIIAVQAAYEGQIEKQLKEEYLADLYIFLAQQYPEIEQPAPETQELRGVEVQLLEISGGVRMWKNYIPQRLSARGTQKACDALRKIIHDFPDQEDQIQPRLLEAEALVRRITWKPPTPEELLQLVLVQEPSNSELSSQLETIDRRTRQMAEEPKIQNDITVAGDNYAPIATSGSTNNQVTIARSESELPKGINWGNWLALISALIAIAAIPIGIFNAEINQQIKKWFGHDQPAKVEQLPKPVNQ